MPAARLSVYLSRITKKFAHFHAQGRTVEVAFDLSEKLFLNVTLGSIDSRLEISLPCGNFPAARYRPFVSNLRNDLASRISEKSMRFRMGDYANSSKIGHL